MNEVFTLDHMVLLYIAAWFIQMGAHEGAHAYVADWCGDDTARLAGRRSFNPFAHVDLNDMSSLMFGVGAPVLTALMGLIPMGMAWVPVTPRKLKGWRRDLAWVSIAGPAANFLVAGLCVPIHAVLSWVGAESHVLVMIFDDLSYAVFMTSLVYGLFNLIPIPPLDGSKVLHYLLPPWGRGVMDQLAPYGMLILVIVFMGGPGSGLLNGPLSWAGRLWWWSGNLF